MTSRNVLRAGNSGMSIVTLAKSVQYANISRQAVQANEVPIAFFRTPARVVRGSAPTTRFYRPGQAEEIMVLPAVFLVILPTIKEIFANNILLYIKGHVLSFHCY
jgi:hypothetical protein